MLDELEHIQHNLKIIRKHLLGEFTGFNITEDTSDAPICHRFTLTDLTTYQQYKLKVGWRWLADKTSTPERTLNSVVHGDVAYKMRKAKGHYLYWQK
jgi:hypothetical protein